jgi:NTE family protein
VIQVNPKRWEGEPRTMVEIADRRNELSGNLSLHQELGSATWSPTARPGPRSS